FGSNSSRNTILRGHGRLGSRPWNCLAVIAVLISARSIARARASAEAVKFSPTGTLSASAPARLATTAPLLAGNTIAIRFSGKVFRCEMKRLNPRVDREKPAPPALGRDARSFRIRVATAPAFRCARVGLPGKCKRFGQLQFARLLGESLRAAYAGRSGWRAPF